jgi:hypothetical protein
MHKNQHAYFHQDSQPHFSFITCFYQESVKSRHPQLHYESKLYMLPQGGSKHQYINLILLYLNVFFTDFHLSFVCKHQLVFLIWSGLEWRGSTMSWSLILLVQVWRTCSTTATEISLLKPYLCLMIRWYHLLLIFFKFLSPLLHHSSENDDPVCWIVSSQLMPSHYFHVDNQSRVHAHKGVSSPWYQARQLPYGLRP